jgi:glycine/D-amino acid oxidase-like deaminating enzyme
MNHYIFYDGKFALWSGGVAGCSAAMHLARAGVRNVVLLEAGSPGDGVAGGSKVPEHAFLTPHDTDEGDQFSYAFKSGSAVLNDPVGTIKMIVNLYPSKTEDFCRHHGEEGARRYLALAREGICIQKALAEEALQNPAEDVRSLGSLYVAEEGDVDTLRREFEALQRLGCEGVEWLEGDALRARAGGQAGFLAGVYFPHDGIINSANVSRCPHLDVENEHLVATKLCFSGLYDVDSLLIVLQGPAAACHERERETGWCAGQPQGVHR